MNLRPHAYRPTVRTRGSSFAFPCHSRPQRVSGDPAVRSGRSHRPASASLPATSHRRLPCVPLNLRVWRGSRVCHSGACRCRACLRPLAARRTDAGRAAVTTGPVTCVLGQQRACPRQPPRAWLGARAEPLLASPSWCCCLRLGFSAASSAPQHRDRVIALLAPS